MLPKAVRNAGGFRDRVQHWLRRSTNRSRRLGSRAMFAELQELCKGAAG